MRNLMLATLLLVLGTDAWPGCSAQGTDPKARFAACQKAAAAGDPEDWKELGNLYKAGEGVAQSDAEALAWYRKAAAQGNAAAIYNLGVMYDNGHGVDKDHALAGQWYRKAIDLGFAPAMYNLGLMYEYGISVKQDYDMAMQLYRQAAELGEPWAQFAIALLYDKGLGVEADLVQAYMWFDIAGEGHEHGLHNRDSVATDMTPEEIERAQRLAAEWRAARPRLVAAPGQ
jgi:TPR repeat protein